MKLRLIRPGTILYGRMSEWRYIILSFPKIIDDAVYADYFAWSAENKKTVFAQNGNFGNKDDEGSWFVVKHK